MMNFGLTIFCEKQFSRTLIEVKNEIVQISSGRGARGAAIASKIDNGKEMARAYEREKTREKHVPVCGRP